MNSDTGQILPQEEIDKMNAIMKAKFLPIKEQLMTIKQKETMQVSKFDSRSALGKIRVQHRNSMRNKPCPCGSGTKFKKCCWNKTR
ncbi:hypothetical protein LCGC14_1052990 [marine sediment metagenome]|uniref:SecA Wing/Scaffold domain-containing protein n=1 Tax=marine sediment metagenome TaxID=412755 RepID=A0A0F9NA63_9ZZZZ